MNIQSFPRLDNMQVALLRFDLYIGIAKDSNLNNLSSVNESSFSIFESVEDATKYAEAFVENMIL